HDGGELDSFGDIIPLLPKDAVVAELGLQGIDGRGGGLPLWTPGTCSHNVVRNDGRAWSGGLARQRHDDGLWFFQIDRCGTGRGGIPRSGGRLIFGNGQGPAAGQTAHRGKLGIAAGSGGGGRRRDLILGLGWLRWGWRARLAFGMDLPKE